MNFNFFLHHGIVKGHLFNSSRNITHLTLQKVSGGGENFEIVQCVSIALECRDSLYISDAFCYQLEDKRLRKALCSLTALHIFCQAASLKSIFQLPAVAGASSRNAPGLRPFTTRKHAIEPVVHFTVVFNSSFNKHCLFPGFILLRPG